VDGIPAPAARIAATEGMKYYIYISDAKVDMLFPQVPHDIKKKVATEWKMDLKLLSASRRTETESDDNRVARLETVIDFIREYGNLGSVDAPDEYIQDTLLMRWGPSKDEDGMVYFSSKTDRTIVGLGGSMRHVIGSNSGEARPYSHFVFDALKFLSQQLRVQARNSKAKQARNAVESATQWMVGPQQRLEFVAKRLSYWDKLPPDFERDEGHTCVLWATPLYVAMAD
jgi:hypothetical protein